MEIVLSEDLAMLFQECIDTVDSYHDPENPQAVSQVCISFRDQIISDPSFVTEMPSYLALALFGAVRFKNEPACVNEICEGNFPAWEDIQIRKSCVELINQIREIDDQVAIKAAVIAFCLKHPDQVRADGISIVRTIEMPVDEKGEDNDEWC